MTPVILLGLIVGIPLVLSLILRVKPLFLFVAIVTGYFWATFLGDTAALVFRSFIQIPHPDVVIRIALLLIPVLFTMLFLRRGVATAALPFQLILMLANALLIATFIIELLTQSVQQTIYMNPIGSVFHQAHDVGIAAIATLHLVVMLFARPKHHDAHGHHGKKH